MFIRAMFATIIAIVAVACDPPVDQAEARNLPLPIEPDTQTAKIADHAVAGDILGECLNGGWPAVLEVEVVDGPDKHDHYRYRFEIVGKAHHDQVACVRERVIEEQP